MVINPQRRRYPEALRLHQRGEGSRADRYGVVTESSLLHARSLARRENAVLRDHGFNGMTR